MSSYQRRHGTGCGKSLRVALPWQLPWRGWGKASCKVRRSILHVRSPVAHPSENHVASTTQMPFGRGSTGPAASVWRRRASCCASVARHCAHNCENAQLTCRDQWPILCMARDERAKKVPVEGFRRQVKCGPPLNPTKKRFWGSCTNCCSTSLRMRRWEFV